MTVSTLQAPTTSDLTITCNTVGWCAGHQEVPGCPGVFLHLSTFDVAPNGTVTALKTYSWADGEPMVDRAWVLTFTPLADAPACPEAWRLEWLRTCAGAA